MHASTSIQVHIRALFSRHVRAMHSAALLAPPPQPPPQYTPHVTTRGRIKRRGANLGVRETKKSPQIVAAEELEKSVKELEKYADAEQIVPEYPSFSEDELLALYEDLSRVPGQDSPELQRIASSSQVQDQEQADMPSISQEEQDYLTLQEVVTRLQEPSPTEESGDDSTPDSPLLQSLKSQRGICVAAEPTNEDIALPTEPHRLVLTRLHQILKKLDAARVLANAITKPPNVEYLATDFMEVSAEAETIDLPQVALPEIAPSILSKKEFEALLRICIAKGDAEAAELALEIGKKTNNYPEESAIDDVLRLYANRGDIRGTERVLSAYIVDGHPTETQIHLHIKCHLKHIHRTEHPSSALRVLHAYEAGTVPLPSLSSSSTTNTPTATLDLSKRKLTPPLKTYNAVIAHLFSCRKTQSKAHAWDLFTHMRYASHPVPDERMYAVMIRACAYSSLPSTSIGVLPHTNTPSASSASNTTAQTAPLPEQKTPYPHTPSLSGTTLVGPERAMDLWLEMTVDHGITPGNGAYNAILLACARSGDEKWIREGWRLVERMKDEGRGVNGEGGLRPDHKTLLALLEGTKRIGDLGRTRWILAEMVKNSVAGDGSVCEEAMVHVFHAYARYRPPFKRTETRLVDEVEDGKREDGARAELKGGTKTETNFRQEAPASVDIEPLQTISSGTQDEGALDTLSADDSGGKAEPPLSSQTSPSSESVATKVPYDLQSAFSLFPPQTRAELLDEVRTLFRHILVDTCALPVESSASSTTTAASDRPFRNVKITTTLLNAYLAVYHHHSTLETIRTLYTSLYTHPRSSNSHKLDLAPPNALTYVDTLERCVLSMKKDREYAASFAKDIWSDWTEFERANAGVVRGVQRSSRISARIIERAHVAMIKALTRSYQLDEALEHIKNFRILYPASDLLPTYRSTRTALVGPRPLVRMSSAAELPDDAVPPFLTFEDLKGVHAGLCKRGPEGRKDVGFVKFVCKAYEGALRKRRECVVKGRVVEQDDDETQRVD